MTTATDTPSEEMRPATIRIAPLRFLLALVVAILLAFVLRVFVLHAYSIPSGSMEDTLLIGDYLLAERISYGATIDFPWRGAIARLPALRAPVRGDIVIFGAWDGSEREFIKRCVALTGDTVEVIESELLVNGVPFDTLLARRFGAYRGRPRVKHLSPESAEYGFWHYTERLRNYGPHVVPPEHIFVVGDNRDNSDDSRTNGDVALTSLRGRPLFIYWSADADGHWWNLITRARWSRVGQIIR